MRLALLALAGLAILALAVGARDPGAIDLGRALAPPSPALWLAADTSAPDWGAMAGEHRAAFSRRPA